MVYSQAASNAVRAMLGRDGSPTAIVASNTFVAADVIRIIHSMGLRIPEDVSVAGFDDDVYSVRLSPPLTTVRQPVYELGEAAVMMALGLYRGTVGPEDTSGARYRPRDQRLSGPAQSLTAVCRASQDSVGVAAAPLELYGHLRHLDQLR